MHVKTGRMCCVICNQDARQIGVTASLTLISRLDCRGEVGLTITRRILEQQPGLQLFSLRADAARRRLIIALDKVRS